MSGAQPAATEQPFPLPQHMPRAGKIRAAEGCFGSGATDADERETAQEASRNEMTNISPTGATP